MSTMISEVYTTFRRARVSENDAKAAAEALSAESLATKDDMKKLEKELLIIKWVVGLVIVVDMLPLLKNIQ